MSRSYLIHGSRCRLHLCCHLYVRKNALPFRQPFNIRASILAYGPCETVTSHKERRVFLFGGINRGLSHVVTVPCCYAATRPTINSTSWSNAGQWASNGWTTLSPNNVATISGAVAGASSQETTNAIYTNLQAILGTKK